MVCIKKVIECWLEEGNSKERRGQFCQKGKTKEKFENNVCEGLRVNVVIRSFSGRHAHASKRSLPM